MTRLELDETDVKILRMLQRDARIPFTSIAEQCNVSTDTIIRSYDRMKKKGIISGTTILLNLKKLGYEYIASFSVDANFPHLNDGIKFMREIPEILWCVPAIGRNNIFSIAIFKDFARLSEVRDSIKSQPHVVSVGTSIWVGEVLLCPENFDLKSRTGVTDE